MITLLMIYQLWSSFMEILLKLTSNTGTFYLNEAQIMQVRLWETI